MSQQHLTDFLADLRTIRPKINIDRKTGRKTSVLGLIRHLRNTVNNPQAIQSVTAARNYCNNPQDARITKYCLRSGDLFLCGDAGTTTIPIRN